MNPYHYFYHVYGQQLPASIWPSFIGAFSGAFFAFIFGLLTYIITRRRERFVQHKNALVKLDRILNRNIDELSISSHIINDTIKILGEGKLTSNRFKNLTAADGIDLELSSISLINKLFYYQSGLNRYNFDVSSFNYSLKRFEDIMIHGQPLVRENLNITKDKLTIFSKEIFTIENEIINLLALTRLHISKTKKESFIYSVYSKIWDFNLVEEDVNAEKRKIKEEIALINQQK